MSPALLVAASMAAMRAPCSAAADSSSARQTWISTCLGRISAEDRAGRRLVEVVLGRLLGSKLQLADGQQPLHHDLLLRSRS